MRRLKISWPRGELIADIVDSPTAEKLFDALPCTSRAQVWGEEVYFGVPVTAALESDARQVVDPGTVCFWVAGSSLALLYGPTPVSQGNECRLISKANVLGKIDGDARKLKTVVEGDEITVTMA